MENNKLDIARVYLCGLAMGAADVVPGVSGGTIAFITGIYTRLLSAIESVNIEFLKLFFTGKFKKALSKIPFSFLIPLLLGIGTAIFSLAKVILYLLAHQPLFIWTFFLGLILASVVLLAREINIYNIKNAVIFTVGAVFAYGISVLTPIETPNSPLYTFLSGAIAICAMILPGISGSFLLVVLGKYQFILNAISTLDVMTILTFAAGAVCGILSFVRVLTYALKHYYSVTIALLTGIMFGSLRRIIIEIPALEVNISLVYAGICLAVGFLLPLILQKISKKMGQ